MTGTQEPRTGRSEATPTPRAERPDKRRLFYGTMERLNPKAIRRIEMAADRVMSREYTMQFWYDVQVYGLYEAYIYAFQTCYLNRAQEEEWVTLHRLVTETCEKTLALSDAR